jgi:hypothetical protein
LAFLTCTGLRFCRSPRSRSSWSRPSPTKRVIAIENTRLFEAEQQRTRELTESLEQETATSEVLHVISSSPGDLQPVFETMLQNAVRICDAKFGNIFRWDGDALLGSQIGDVNNCFRRHHATDGIFRTWTKW